MQSQHFVAILNRILENIRKGLDASGTEVEETNATQVRCGALALRVQTYGAYSYKRTCLLVQKNAKQPEDPEAHVQHAFERRRRSSRVQRSGSSSSGGGSSSSRSSRSSKRSSPSLETGGDDGEQDGLERVCSLHLRC
jgi:uncharacterized membrane protein YgcG